MLVDPEVQAQGMAHLLRADAALCPSVDVSKDGNGFLRLFGHPAFLNIACAHQVQYMLFAP